MYDICALGEILIDAIASADTSIQIMGNAGGAPANVLTCASRMGLKTAFLAKAGDDFIGGWLKRVLDGVGIDTAGLILDSTKTPPSPWSRWTALATAASPSIAPAAPM